MTTERGSMNRPMRIEPAPGQESVWDYPRPPRVESTSRHIEVLFNGRTIADSRRSIRVLETGHPPTYYIPLADILPDCLVPSRGESQCEWKGRCHYYSVVVDGKKAQSMAWYYPDPSPPYSDLKDHVAFYAAPMDACYVDGALVTPQPGGYYGGWITPDIVGPFKGSPGSAGW